MDEVPTLVLQKILGLLSFKDRGPCREVCRRWMTGIGRSPYVGLSLKIDNGKPGMLNFLESVFVKEVNVTTLILSNSQEVDLWKDLKLEDCKTMILSGYTNSLFINGNLLQENKWSHLCKLYFCGTFLIGQEIFQNEAETVNFTCVFPNLKELHFILSHSTIYKANEHIKMIPDFVMPSFQGLFHWFDRRVHILKLLSERAHRNTSYLLRILEAPDLQILHVFLDTSTFWDLEPLYKFIEAHPNLEQLVISPQEEFYAGFIPNPYPDIGRRLSLTKAPMNLQSVYFRNIDPVQIFWQDLVTAQEHLEELSLNFTTFPKSWFNNFMNTLIIQNYGTLKSLYVTGNDTGRRSIGLELDMKPFNIMDQLEIIVISAKGRNQVPYPSPKYYRRYGGGRRPPRYSHYPRNFRIRNINDLPTSIKVFETSFFTCEDFDGVRFLHEKRNLEELKLPCITRTGFLEHRHQVSEFVQTAQNHRRLNIFKIRFNFSKSIVPDIGGEWKDIRPIDPEYPIRNTSRLLAFARVAAVGPLVWNIVFLPGLLRRIELRQNLHKTGLIEKFYLEPKAWAVVYFRNLFEALDAKDIPGYWSEQPFLNRKMTYIEIPSRMANHNFWPRRSMCLGLKLKPPRCLDESSSPDQYHTAVNFKMSNIEVDVRTHMEFLTDINTWHQLRLAPKGFANHDEEIEDSEVDSDEEEDADKEHTFELVHIPDPNFVPVIGSDLPNFIFSKICFAADRYELSEEFREILEIIREPAEAMLNPN